MTEFTPDFAPSFATDFDEFRAAASEKIGATFAKLLPSLSPKLDLAEDRALDAACYAFDAGGKRLRGILVATSAAAVRHDGTATNDAWAAAVSIELMHSYSLVHDDLPAMDDDDMRRGKPTTHKAFDEATAILAGDGLQSLAFQILGQSLKDTDPADALMLVAELGRSAGFDGMVGGQMLDILAESADQPFDLATTKRLQGKKTGALLRYSCRAGAILNGERGDALAHLDRFGAKIGLSFQIVDDLLDLHGDAAVVGKAVGKDKDAAKATFIDLLGEDSAQNEVQKLTQDAVESTEFLRSLANSSAQDAAIKQLRHIAEFIANRHH